MRKLSTLLLCIFSLAAAYGAKFEETKYKGIPYVTLKSFCKKLEFAMPQEIKKNAFQIKGVLGKIKLSIHSRECYINGIRYWMSFSLERQKNGEFIISKMDLEKLFLPILQPEKYVSKKPALGVIIDAGHGGSNKGAVARNGLMEKNLNLDTARLLREVLKKEGIPCVMTRNSDKYLSLEARARFTQRYPAYIFVSLHYNEGKRTSRGVETFCLTPHRAASTGDSKQGLIRRSRVEKGNEQDEANMLLASLIHREITQLHPSEGDRGLKRARFVVLRRSRVPAVLVEGGFMSGKIDLDIIKTQEYRQFLAEKIAVGVKKFMKIMNAETKVSKTSKKLEPKEEKEFLSPAVDLREADKTKPDLETETPPPSDEDAINEPQDGSEPVEQVLPELSLEEAIIKRELEIVLEQAEKEEAEKLKDKALKEKYIEEQK